MWWWFFAGVGATLAIGGGAFWLLLLIGKSVVPDLTYPAPSDGAVTPSPEDTSRQRAIL